MENLDTIFETLKSLLIKYSREFDVKREILDSKAKVKKEQVHLYGKKIVSIIPSRKPQATYVSGIIKQKDFVGFYSMPIYSHPNSFVLSPELKKALKGKSCFHVKKLNPELLSELETVLKNGIELYRKEGWI